MTTQSEFSRAILDPHTPVPEGIIRPDGTQATKRFNVYRNNVIVSLIEALGQGYPMVKKRVGEAFFNAVAGRFVRRFPPVSPLMILYGTQFAQYLESMDEIANVPWLPDLARLERARIEAFHAADAVPDGLAVLANMSAETMMQARATLLPSTRLVLSQFPILSIWSALTQDQVIPEDRPGENIIIARPEMEVEIHPLTQGSAAFIASLQNGSSFATALEKGTTFACFDLSQTIGSLFEARLLASITLEKNA